MEGILFGSAAAILKSLPYRYMIIVFDLCTLQVRPPNLPHARTFCTRHWFSYKDTRRTFFKRGAILRANSITVYADGSLLPCKQWKICLADV